MREAAGIVLAPECCRDYQQSGTALAGYAQRNGHQGLFRWRYDGRCEGRQSEHHKQVVVVVVVGELHLIVGEWLPPLQWLR
jgi:hypothetical protein